jgi:hypothetical protein
MVDEITTARELATHASDISHLQEDMDAMRADVAAIRIALDEINKKFATAEGGLKVLMWAGGLGSAIIGAITGYFSSKGF